MLTLNVLCFVLFDLICYFQRLDAIPEVNKSNDFISKFLELQSDACGYVEMCTITRKENFTFTSKTEPCCRPCSCQHSCVNKGTCCPDFRISDVIGDSVQNDESKPYENDTDDFADEDSCVSSWLISRDIKFGFKGGEGGFIMISFCPSSQADVKLKSGCEDAEKIKTTRSEIIPVTSIDSNRTYRNMFCLLCHEGYNTKYILWKSLLTCSQKDVVQQFIVQPEKLFRSVALGYFTFCNIVFKPPSDMKSSVEVCNQIDVSSCPKATDNHTNSKSKVYDELCRRFYLPVIKTKLFTYTIYRNIACFMCNTNETFSDVCPNMSPQYGLYELEINIIDVTSDEFYDLEKSKPLLNLRFDAACQLGNTYDEMTNKCRKVFCPRHFYIYKGACVAILSYVQGVFFDLMLEVNPPDYVKTKNDIRQQYEEAIDMAVTQEVEKYFLEIRTDIWRTTMDNTLQTNVIGIKFKNVNDTYADIIQKLELFLNNIHTLRIDSLMLSATVTIANVIESRAIGKFKHLYDSKTGIRLTPVRVSNVFSWTEQKFQLSKAHVCRRVELNESEVRRTGKYSFKVLRTGVTIEGENLDFLDNGNVLACLSDAILANVNVDSDASLSFVANVEQDLTLLVVFGALLFLVGVVVIGRLVRRCLQSQRSE